MVGSACRYWFFLLWSSIILIAGLSLFTGGFLLRRQVLSDKAECYNHTNPYVDSCNAVPRQFGKAIVVIIDALKYEFVVYNKSLVASNAKPYQNRLPILHELTHGGHKGGRMFEFLADPPTTTMQRLKGLTTGSLPTFVDVSSNFASAEINEDNIIDQLVDRGKRIVFAGDDTWMGLFPGRFDRAYPFPSFDVWDLDTVDNGVTKHLYQELRTPERWEVLIGHYLGVDHAGHKFGPSHVEMTRKLNEMNNVIGHVAANMPEDCVLFVMGDHGMTMDGDHGGGSWDEVSAALFIYGKKLNSTLPPPPGSDRRRTVNQVDFVPTFSLLLGLPIPFSNLGKVIHDVMVPAAIKQIQYVRVNVEQVYRYLQTYMLASTRSGGKPLPSSTFKSIQTMAEEFRGKKSRVLKSTDVEAALVMGSGFLSSAKAMCQSTFIEFNLRLITSGLTVTLLHACLLLVLMLTPKNSFLRNIINVGFLANLFVSSAIGACLGTAVLHLRSNGDRESSGMPVVVASTAASLMVFGFTLLWRLRHSLNDVYASLRVDAEMLTYCGLCLFMCFGLHSNSFVVEEAKVHNFCLVTLIVSWSFKYGGLGANGGRRPRAIIFAIVCMGLCRLSNTYFRCREEQQKWCEATDYHKPIGNLAHDVSRVYKNWRFFFTIFSVLVAVTTPHLWLRRCGNLNGLSVPVALAQYVPPAVGLGLVFNWALQGLPSEIASALLPWQHGALASFVLVVCACTIAAVVGHPRLLYVFNSSQTRSTEFLRVNEGVRTYYNILKSNWRKQLSTCPAQEQKILVYGVGTGISAAYVVIATLFALASMLVVGDGLCPSVCLMMLCTALLLFITSWSRIHEAFRIPEVRVRLLADRSSGAVFNKLHQVPWSAIISWYLMEGLFFYATGHQPSFPSIQWSAAFVGGLSGSEYGTADSSAFFGYVVPALFIGWNTYVSRLWFGLLLPLLLLAPFATWLALPAVRPDAKSCVDREAVEEELAKGEIFLMENKEETRSQLFALCVKYCVLHCLKTFACMLSAALLRRHLMVWKIFAPRFIFEGVGLVVSLSAVLVGYVLFVRIQTAVSSYFHGIHRQSKIKC